LYGTYGEFDTGSDFWEQVVPLNYLDGVIGAIEVHHAADDTVVNIGYSLDLMKNLDSSNITHEFYEYPTGGHNIEGTSFTTAIKKTVEFFDEYLKEL